MNFSNPPFSWEKPKLIHQFGQLEQVVDLTLVKNKPHWYNIRKKSTLYIATNHGVYAMELLK